MEKKVKANLPYKPTKEGTQIIEEQIQLIKKLGKIDKLLIDGFGPIGEKNIDWFELNYYVKPYPKDDEFKGQRHLIHGSLHCDSEEEIIFDLQNIIDVMYFMRYRMPSPKHLYFPNRYGEFTVKKQRMSKAMKESLKNSVPL